MALLEKHRSIIYAHFVETIGEEAAEAMLSQFPARELDEPVTKEFVEAQITDVRREIAELRGEMHTGFAQLRLDMAEQTDRLMTRMQIIAGMGFGFFAILTVVTH
jgi:hypothetical protein